MTSAIVAIALMLHSADRGWETVRISRMPGQTKMQALNRWRNLREQNCDPDVSYELRHNGRLVQRLEVPRQVGP